jgi:glyoxylase-like metal-dependent hydrolase (beta-lactamase superfamily II)/8-oxo-dGTP pyrophosphatase MutT (NUDIX family)
VSAAFPGIPPAPPPPEPVLATAVVLHRPGPEGREVLLVRRGDDQRFAGGFHAFPGGRLDPEDRDVPVAGASGEEAALVACATRELFEETGILLAEGAARVPARVRAEGRRALLAGKGSWAGFLREAGASLSAEPLVPAGRWVTPPMRPIRFDARFFLAELPGGERPEIWPGELVAGDFVPAARAVARWERGELLLHPPQLHPLQVLARPGTPDVSVLRAPPEAAKRIEFQQGIVLTALRTPTLPPATHTNCWIVSLDRGAALVDPGAPDPREQERLFRMVDALAAEGRAPREVWLTHAHADHVGAAAAVSARYGIPVKAHRLAEGRVPGTSIVPLREGDLLGGRFLVLETPGHAREHLAFLDERSGAVLCGDLVSTLSTIVIDPPEGDMAEYLRQLERLRALAPRTLFPAHGPPAPDGAGRLAMYLAHRREREGLVLAALRAGGTLEEVTARAYADTPPAMYPVAQRSCLASLWKLRDEGRAREDGGRWVRSSAGAAG